MGPGTVATFTMCNFRVLRKWPCKFFQAGIPYNGRRPKSNFFDVSMFFILILD